jgi:hypothetical protein
MTTYAPNWTPRYKAHYVACALPHSITLRTIRGDTIPHITALADVAHDIFEALAAKLTDDFAWVSAEYAVTDSDVWVPAATPVAVTGLFDAADFSTAQKISPTTFSGKAASSRARFSCYGVVWAFETPGNAANDFVINGAEDADVAAVVTAVSGRAFAGSGEVTMWHNRATYKVNDRLVKRARQGLL